MCVSVVDIGHRFVYYLNMASVQPKVINGKTYYYLVESARVGGKPRIVSQRYLGSAADITAALDGATVTPARTQHLGFGALAAVWGLLDRLGYVGIVDDVVGARRSDAGASVGAYLALACANRVVARPVRSWPSSTGGPPPPVTAGSRRLPPDWITAGSGMPCTRSTPPRWSTSSVGWPRPWQRSSTSGCPRWRWT